MSKNDDALQAMEAELAAEMKRLDDAKAAREAAAESPEAKALAMKAKLDAVRAAREAEERALTDDRAWLDAVAKHGQRVKRVHTSAGDIILRANTAAEVDAVQARAEEKAAAAMESGDAVRANADSIKAYREGIFTTNLVHPTIGAARAIVEKFPGVWGELYNARDMLNRGPIEAAGKGVAR